MSRETSGAEKLGNNLPYNRYYKALTFYLQEQPNLLTDLLTVLIPRIDHSRVVRMFRQIDHIPLIRSYLIAVQHVSDVIMHFLSR